MNFTTGKVTVTLSSAPSPRYCRNGMLLILTATLPDRYYYYNFLMDEMDATSRWQSQDLKSQATGLISTISQSLIRN